MASTRDNQPDLHDTTDGPRSMPDWLDALADAPSTELGALVADGLRTFGATRIDGFDAGPDGLSVEGPPEAQDALRMARAVLRARRAGGMRRGTTVVHRSVVGALTSGLAHELNNPLAAVIANLDLATRQVEEQLRTAASYSWLDDVAAELQDAQQAANQLHGIVRRLRPLGPRAPSRDDADLDSVLQACLVLLGRELRLRGRVRHATPSATPAPVRPSWHLTTHAVVGLLSYVLQALPTGDEKREITLTVEVRSRDAVTLQVTVRPGIATPTSPEALAARKLAMALAVEAEATWIEGAPDPVEWSCALAVPLRKEMTPSTLPPRQQAERVGRVLVIDDEPLIGKLVQRILGAHEVVATYDGTTGLSRARKEAWDLVLVDMNLPDLSGDVVASELATLDPEKAKTVVRMSGGLVDARPDGRPVLSKPFDARTLRALLQRRLDAR